MASFPDYPLASLPLDGTELTLIDQAGVTKRLMVGAFVNTFPIRTITDTSHTLEPADFGYILDFTNPAACTLDVPADLTPAGFWCLPSQGGTGQVKVMPAPGSGVHIVNKDGFFATDKQFDILALKQFSPTSYRLYGPTSGGIAIPAQQITNYFGPQLGDSAINTAYSGVAGGGQGVPGALAGWVTTGLIPVTPGVTYTIDLYAADIAWLLDTSTPGDGAYFYSATPATNAHLTGLVKWADMVSFTTDGGSATFTVPMDSTAFVAFNVKWALGGAFIVGRPVPTGVQASLLNSFMLNKSTAAVVQSAYGAPGTVDQVTTPLALQPGQMATIFNGQWSNDALIAGYIYKRYPWNATYDLVQRMYYYAESYYQNNNLQFTSICLIPVATPGPSTPGAFGAAYSSNTITTVNPFVQSDMAVGIVQDSAKAMGGSHGIECWLTPATSHGLVNANRGAIYSDGVRNWTVARIGNLTGGDPNNLFLMPQITGDATNWSYSVLNITGTTLTHVSGGGSPPATVTITGTPVDQRLFPANQNTAISFQFNGGTIPVANGVYVDTGIWFYLQYNIPNVYGIQTTVLALTGVTTDSPSQYNAGPSQLGISMNYFNDPYAAMTAYYQVTALETYNRNGMWPSQNQGGPDMANYGAGETFHEFMEGVQPFAPNFPQTGGTIDFSTFPDMTSNSDTFWALAGNWQPPSYYADNEAHNATFAIHGVQDSGNNWIRSKWCMANDDVDGRSASADPTVIPQSYFFSAADKMYMVTANIEGNTATAYNTQVPQGTVDLSIGGFGMEHPALADPTNSYGSFVYTKPGAVLAWRWYTASTLTNYPIPIRPDMIGKSIQIIKQAATVTVIDTVVTAQGVHVTTTGPGGFSAILS